jgi:hypothetical protein
VKYLNGEHFVWCSESYDPGAAATGSASASVAPSASPRTIFDVLHDDCAKEERHSALINGYRKTFKRLATDWLSAGRINKDEFDEIVAVVKGPSWRIWRPVLYVIPRAPIELAGRLHSVPYRRRASYGAELLIKDLVPKEFDLIECQL